MTPADFVIRGRRVITPHGVAALCVVASEGVIVALQSYDDVPPDVNVIDAGDDVLLPGLVDTHVHMNEPGRAEWEGFETGTRAAAAGGITTVVDMPLNSVPAVTHAAALAAKRAAAHGRCHVDVGFWGGVVPGNEAELAALWDAGVLGFKCFMAPSGVDEFGAVTAHDLVRVLPHLAERATPLLVHAELPSRLLPPSATADPRRYMSWLATRPDDAEADAVRTLIDLCRETRVRMHVVHVASDRVPPLIRAAHDEALPLSAETCPHYLHFAAEDIADGRTELKCAPPIRSRSAREALWRALLAGDLALIASDHSPAPPALKCTDSGSFLDAWGGIASLQLMLPVVWTGAHARGIPLARLAEWLAAAPARLAALPQKGAIDVGRDADVVIFDPDASWTVDAAQLHHRHALTPWHGATLRGAVRSTYLRGRLVYDARAGHTGRTPHTAPRGELLERPAAPLAEA